MGPTDKPSVDIGKGKYIECQIDLSTTAGRLMCLTLALETRVISFTFLPFYPRNEPPVTFKSEVILATGHRSL
jgi:hypothetical protein